jgi:hypothetical protein
MNINITTAPVPQAAAVGPHDLILRPLNQWYHLHVEGADVEDILTANHT